MAAPKGYRQFVVHAASAYGFDPGILDKVAELESGRRPGAVNDWDSNAAAGIPSKGIMQFIEPTFKAYARHARDANPAAWKGVKLDWQDWRAQMLAASWAMKNGHGKAWATWDRAQGAAKGRLRRSTTPFAGVGGTQVGSSPQGGAKPETGVSLTGQQRSVLGMVFKGNDFMQSLIDLVPAPSLAPIAAATPVKRSPTRARSSSGSIGGNVAALPRKKGEPDWKYLQRLGRNLFGLENDPGDSQTTGGRHTTNSQHYTGNAVDFGDARNSRKQLNAWKDWLAKNSKALGITELLDEGDHIHVGTR